MICKCTVLGSPHHVIREEINLLCAYVKVGRLPRIHGFPIANASLRYDEESLTMTIKS